MNVYLTKLFIITTICLINVPTIWLAVSESAVLPLPQKISDSQLQRDDCLVNQNTEEDEFEAYIEEFLFTDSRADISLYSCINWTEGFLKSEGIGKKASYRAAALVARNNALKTLFVVNLHSDVKFRDYLTLRNQIHVKIRDVLIKNADIQELPADPGEPDLAKVMIRIPFYGISGLTSFLIDDRDLFHRVRQVSSSLRNTLKLPISPEKLQSSELETHSEVSDFSGVIIDARHLSSLQPALLPKIISEDGEVIYEASQVENAVLQTHGMIEYVTGGNLQKVSRRIGKNPLRIRPLLLASAGSPSLRYPLLAQEEETRKRRRKGNHLIVDAADSEGQIPVNVVISVEDAKKLKELNEEKQIDKQGKYTILIGGEIGGVRGQYPDGLYAAYAFFL